MQTLMHKAAKKPPAIYFAGSIRGGRGDQALYAQIINHLKRFGTVLTEHFGHANITSLKGTGSKNSRIYEENVLWLRQADVMVAEVTQPSLGVGYEIAKAEELGKPILCLYRPQEGRTLSAMIAGNPSVVVNHYQTIDEVPAHLESFFSSDTMKKKRKKQSSTKLFMIQALRSLKKIGSIVPSSPHLTKKMIEIIPRGFNGTVVELGVGTGVFTKALLEKLGEKATIIAFEDSKDLVEFVQNTIHDPRLTVVHGQAQTALHYVHERNVDTVDYVISGLPLGSMDKAERQAIVDVIYDMLSPSGVYVQFQYFLSSLLTLKKKFKNVKVVHYELKNIPPAFVYECRKD